MARGLSKLQQAILLLGFLNRAKPVGQECQFTRREVLQLYYGWQPCRQSVRRSSRVFRRDQVGLAKYQAAQVSLTKAIKRLAKRGLVDYTPHRMTVTSAGIRVIEAMVAYHGSGMPTIVDPIVSPPIGPHAASSDGNG